PLLRVLDRLDRYQTSFTAKYYGENDDDARQKLLDKINRIPANLEAEEAAGQFEGAGPAPAEAEAKR
ncbi:MAG: hypothetical protein JO288_22890, partial [Hyphomicrobiales bacterium]|nr:hypothetical protein [Hyphomicrobiales bacterium]